jgi:hypothetical protein
VNFVQRFVAIATQVFHKSVVVALLKVFSFVSSSKFSLLLFFKNALNQLQKIIEISTNMLVKAEIFSKEYFKPLVINNL